MEFARINHDRQQAAGLTLPELLVGTAVAMLLLLAAASFYLFSLTSFASVSNYADLNRKDRHASDLLTRDIRSATAVVTASSTQLVLAENIGGSSANVTYSYDADAGTLTRTLRGFSETLLTGVKSLSWTLYSRPSTNVYDSFPVTTSVSSAKLISAQWNCSRRVFKGQRDSETVQTAMTELRNQ
jgi:hypothetical protein